MLLKLSFLLTIIHIVMSGTINDTTHPNVIIMHVNNLNWNDLGIHVNRVDNENSTPNIDRLAYAGIILNRFYANGGSESLYSGCYRRSSYGKPNLMSTYFERNGYKVNNMSLKNFTKTDTFTDAILSSISIDNEPFLLSVDFGYLGFDMKISILDDIVGTIITKLYEREVLDNTIIIFLSLPMENAYEMKLSPIEINLRRTAIIYSRLLAHPQSTSNQLIHISDILPTLVDAAHLTWRTKERILIDGVNQWMALNSNDNHVRTSLFGDNFYIDNYLKLSYGTSKSIVYESIDNQQMESTRDDNYDFSLYIRSIISSEVHNLFDDITVNKIMMLRNRVKIRCNKNDVNETVVINIRCSPADPCLFDLQTDPCEFDDMQQDAYDTTRNRLIQVFEGYLNDGNAKDLTVVENGHVNSTDVPHVTSDPILTPSGGFDAFLTLGIILAAFLVLLIVIVCVKERCNSRRSVYLDKSKDVTFKDESGVDINKIPSISANVENKSTE